MAIVRGIGYREPKGVRVVTSAGKELPISASKQDQACYILSGRIEQALGEEGGTVADIYHEVTGPLGLSSTDTIQLVRICKGIGYLK